MKVGVTLRNMGPESSKESLLECATMAEEAGLDHVWVVDHIAIPPDDAEGSEGRYLDPLAASMFLAATTSKIEFGISVLVLPYRPPLPTAKWVATIQELSEGRFHLGVGAGWMKEEFRALGVEREKRGEITNDTLEVMLKCFNAPDDCVEINGQKILFRPRPPRPPIYVGGMGLAAKRRAVRYGDGWMPIRLEPDELEKEIQSLVGLAEEANRPVPKIVFMGSLPSDRAESCERLQAFEELGVSHFIEVSRYTDRKSFEQRLVRVRP